MRRIFGSRVGIPQRPQPDESMVLWYGFTAKDGVFWAAPHYGLPEDAGLEYFSPLVRTSADLSNMTFNVFRNARTGTGLDDSSGARPLRTVRQELLRDEIALQSDE